MVADIMKLDTVNRMNLQKHNSSAESIRATECAAGVGGKETNAKMDRSADVPRVARDRILVSSSMEEGTFDA